MAGQLLAKLQPTLQLDVALHVLLFGAPALFKLPAHCWQFAAVESVLLPYFPGLSWQRANAPVSSLPWWPAAR
jgi:hypothetical protein